MSLHADLRLRLGHLDLDVTIEVAAGEVVALTGPNGAGKTTILRAIAGLQPIDAGRITLGGRIVDDPGAAVRLSPSDRATGVVFQDHLLLPHLDARDNVAFGLRVQGRRRRDARATAEEWLDRVGLVAHARARPAQLSGGQAQRVALARALATDPAVLLLDEPLAALDVASRRQVRTELRQHLGAYDGATLLVTHDPVEALTLADRLIVVEAGRVTQTGTPAEVAHRPRSPWAARLVGVNLLHGCAEGQRVRVGGGTLTTAEAHRGEVDVLFHPRAVALYREPPAGSPRNTWAARIDDLDVEGTRVRVHLVGPFDAVAEVTPSAVADLGLTVGAHVHATVKAVDVDVHPR